MDNIGPTIVPTIDPEKPREVGQGEGRAVNSNSASLPGLEKAVYTVNRTKRAVNSDYTHLQELSALRRPWENREPIEPIDRLIKERSAWNIWRMQHPEVRPDLSGYDLRDADLSGYDLRDADLRKANLRKADLRKADLSDADLSDKTFSDENFSGANLSGANLIRANLSRTLLIETNFTGATLTDCIIYGIAAWNVQLEGARQDNLIITPDDEPVITVDNLEVAQFTYLLLNNKKIRDVINTITTKVVLILGRFTPERKTVLDALREGLRKQNYLPIVFDFEKPGSRNFTETVRTLAHLARFIIADLTDPSSIPQELQAIIPTLAVPVQPVLLEGKREYAMFVDFLKTYHWVLPVHYYLDQVNLLTTLKEHVIEPAERKAKELAKLRAQEFEKQ
jgi:hypothetical protein